MKKAYCIIAFLFFITLGQSQNRELDSLKSLLKKEMHDTSRLLLLYDIINVSEEGFQEDYTKMLMELAKKNIALQKTNSPLLKHYEGYLADAYFFEGTNFIASMDLAKAINSYEKSMVISIKHNNKHNIATCKLEIAKVLTMQENYKKAIATLYEALKLLQSLNKHKDIGNTYINIGRIYRRQKNYSKAIEFFKNGLDSYNKVNFKPGMLDALTKLSNMYFEMQDSTQAILHTQKTQEVIKSMSESEKAPYQTLINNIEAKLFQANGNNEKAIEYLTKNIELLKRSNVLIELSSTYSHLANIYNATKQYKKAIFYLQQALKISTQTNNTFGMYSEYEKLYHLYKLTGDTKNALKMHELFVSVSDTIQRKKDEKHVLEAELKYQFEKKELLAKAANDKKISDLNLLAERKNAKKMCYYLFLEVHCSCLLQVLVLFIIIFVKKI